MFSMNLISLLLALLSDVNKELTLITLFSFKYFSTESNSLNILPVTYIVVEKAL